MCLLTLLAMCIVASPAVAQAYDYPHRLKKLYDFEDTDDRGKKIGFSGKLMPRNWYAIGRRAAGEKGEFHAIPLNKALENQTGYPQYAPVGFDRSHKAGGDFSLRLGMAGGKTGAYIQHGAIDVKAGSDYRVSAKVQTRKLEHAWAEMRAYFVDQHGRQIEGSLKRSKPIVESADWQTVAVKLTGDFDDAAFIGIELHILQPGMDRDDPIADHQVVPSDIHGGAWFDDVAVWELPSVNLSTGVDTNIIQAPDKPTLRARVRDLTGRKMRAVINVYNHHYEPIDRVEDDIDKAGWSWTPDLGDRYGWYWADLEIFEVGPGGRLSSKVARTLTGFLWLPPGTDRRGDDRSRFRLIAEDVPTHHLTMIADLMRQAQLSSLVVSGWEPHGTPASTAQRARILEPITRDLIVRRGYIAVSFWPLPVELATRAGVDAVDPLNLLTKPSEDWMDYAKPFLAPLGQRLNDWQVGSSSLPRAFLARDLAGDLAKARAGVRLTAPNPSLVAPWRLDQPRRAEELAGQDSYAVAWPQGVTPGQLQAALEGWPVPPEDMRLDIELADAADMLHERRVADLMLRVLHAWELQVGSVGLAKPWTEGYERRATLTPDPVLGAWVTLTRQLEGQRVIGRMPLVPGVNAMILDGPQGGMLAVWNEDADEDPQRAALYLGDSPTLVDPFGNTSPVPTVGNKHVLHIGKTPQIIRGIDPRLALMRAGFKVDEPFIQSLQVAHRRVLKIHNPWPRTLNGFYTFTGPDRWTIQPQRKHISIAPGDVAEVPILLRFPIHENGGHKTLSADFVFNVGEDYAVTLTSPLELGLRGVDFSAAAIVEPGAEPDTVDAIVTLTITNTSDKRQSLNVFAGIQGHARRELIIPGIAPGEFVSRRIRFKDVGEQVGKSPLRCGVRESNGPAVLNQTLDLLPPRKESPDLPGAIVGVDPDGE